MKLIFTLIIILFIPLSLTAQKVLELTNDRSQRKILLKEGKRVRCISLAGIQTGRLRNITDNTITVDDQVIKIKEIAAIGRRRRGTHTLAFLSMFMGMSVIIDNFSDSNAGMPTCANCASTPIQHTTAVDVLAVALGGTLIGLGVWIETANSPHLMGKWSVETVKLK